MSSIVGIVSNKITIINYLILINIIIQYGNILYTYEYIAVLTSFTNLKI